MCWARSHGRNGELGGTGLGVLGDGGTGWVLRPAAPPVLHAQQLGVTGLACTQCCSTQMWFHPGDQIARGEEQAAARSRQQRDKEQRWHDEEIKSYRAGREQAAQQST